MIPIEIKWVQGFRSYALSRSNVLAQHVGYAN